MQFLIRGIHSQNKWGGYISCPHGTLEKDSLLTTHKHKMKCRKSNLVRKEKSTLGYLHTVGYLRYVMSNNCNNRIKKAEGNAPDYIQQMCFSTVGVDLLLFLL